jgi:peptide/nickel transport system ATP-binding protein
LALAVKNLSVEFATPQAPVSAVEQISFDVTPGKTLGVVGESGCGKSVTALSILRLLPAATGRISGSIEYHGKNLVTLDRDELRRIRGNTISMIFQEPMTSLNPVLKVGEQVAEVVRLHRHKSRKEAREFAISMFQRVGIPAPEERIHAYAHELSGGMRQRVMIAMALACEPEILIADEPTTALDVTIQAQILELLRKLQSETGMGIMLISHDLGVIAETCDEVLVMYAGRVVEQARTDVLFRSPRHPYTNGLIRSVVMTEARSTKRRSRLHEIPGMVPSLHARPTGCKFQDRCPAVTDICRSQEPPLAPLGDSLVRCHHPVEQP